MHGIVRQLQVAHAFVADQVSLKDDVQIALLQLLAEVARSVGGDFDFHGGEGLHQSRHQRAEPGVNHRVHHADAHQALLRASVV
ncbi:hypothetical protein D3C72_2260720 [compost metagenome]